MNNLLPCPFCGSDQIKRSNFYLKCDGCHIGFAIPVTSDVSLESGWNRRPAYELPDDLSPELTIAYLKARLGLYEYILSTIDSEVLAGTLAELSEHCVITVETYHRLVKETSA